MKLLLMLLTCCSVSGVVNAQKLMDFQKQGNYEKVLEQFRARAAVRVLRDSMLLLGYNTAPIAPGKPGVYRLPQDGMPCIVPDTKEVAAIPNGFKGKASIPFTGNPPRIPNPSTTQPFRYEHKTFTLPKK